MSLNNRRPSSGHVTYLKIFNGKIVRESDKTFASELELKDRENKTGRKVYYVEYDSISGIITHAEMKHIDALGIDFIALTIKDGPDTYNLSIGAQDKYGKTFMMRMMNIDINKEVDITPYSFEDKEGKKVAGVNIYQNGEKLPSLYTREVPNGLPEAKQVRKGKEMKWDFTDQLNFLYDQFDVFKAKFPEVEPETARQPVSAPAAESEDYDDLPF